MADPPRTLRHQSDYRAHRAATYPQDGEALDAIADGFRALQQQGFDLPPKTIAWLDARDEVKSRFKKPTV